MILTESGDGSPSTMTRLFHILKLKKNIRNVTGVYFDVPLDARMNGSEMGHNLLTNGVHWGEKAH